jgi:hypothetical protein
MANTATITAFAGNVVKLDVTVYNVGTTTPFDLTGITIIKYGLAASEGGAPIVTKGLGTGIAVLNAVGGLLEVTLLETDTTALDGVYWQEVLVVDTSGDPVTVYSGYVQFNPASVKN